MRNIVLSLFTALSVSLSVTGGAASYNTLGNLAEERRATNTCADPTLADVYVAAFSPSTTAHIIRPRYVPVFIATAGADWQIQGPLFLAWETVQDFTVPLYQLSLASPLDTDFLFVASTDGSIPAVSGYTTPLIVGYIYSTQVCNSVALLGAAQVAATDHWYTTSTREHSNLLAKGWTDAGTVGFVLPLNSS